MLKPLSLVFCFPFVFYFHFLYEAIVSLVLLTARIAEEAKQPGAPKGGVVDQKLKISNIFTLNSFYLFALNSI